MSRKYEGLIVLNTKGNEDSVDELVGGDEHRRDATQFKIVDVVHTARRATASIRQGLDDHLTLGGDLMAKVNRCRFGKGRLHVSLNIRADPSQPFFDSVEKHVAARFGDVEEPNSETSERGGSRQPFAFDECSFAGRIEDRCHDTVLVRDGPSDRLGALVAVDPTADDLAEQAGTAARIGEHQPARSEFRERLGVAECFGYALRDSVGAAHQLCT